MFVIGVLAIVFTPIYLLLAHQQTSGDVALLDFLFSFLFAGVAAVAFHALFGKRYRVQHKTRLPFKKPAEHWFLQLFLIALTWAWLAIALLFLLHTNSVQSVVAAGLLVGSYMIASRKDLFWDALWSGALMASVFFFLYVATFIRDLHQLSAPFFLNIPSDTLLLSATLGFVLGPLYEYVRGFKLKNRHR